MIDATIVWGDIVIIQKEALLYYEKLVGDSMNDWLHVWKYVHLLKLVTGVEISTLAVNKSGRPGKDANNNSRTAAAAPKRAAFLLSTLMVVIGKYYVFLSERMKLNHQINQRFSIR